MVGTAETFIRERPLRRRAPAHYGRGRPEDPRGAVTNEDYAGAAVRVRVGARGTFEASRAIVGPESQMAFDVYGTEGALGWNLEGLNELQVYRRTTTAAHRLHDRARRRPLPLPRRFVPGSANGIGFEDLVVIEDLEFLRSVAERPPVPAGLRRRRWRGCRVQAALLRSVETEHAGRTSYRCREG